MFVNEYAKDMHEYENRARAAWQPRPDPMPAVDRHPTGATLGRKKHWASRTEI